MASPTIPTYPNNNPIIVEMLSKELVRNLDKYHIVLNWCNRKYEWDIKSLHDTVRVQTMPDINYGSGTTAWNTIAETSFTITNETLVINQLAQVNVPIADQTQLLSNFDQISKVANRLAYGLADTYEKFAINTALSWALIANKLYTWAWVALTSATIFKYMDEMRVRFSTNNVYWKIAVFLKPAIASLIRQSSVFDGFREWMLFRNESAMTSYVGRFAWMEIYETNNIPTNQILAMDMEAVNFAEQVSRIDVRDKDNAFTKSILWEALYGAKVFAENSKRIVTLDYA